jgi:hypothetical protein
MLSNSSVLKQITIPKNHYRARKLGSLEEEEEEEKEEEKPTMQP